MSYDMYVFGWIGTTMETFGWGERPLTRKDRIILLLNRNFEIWFDLTWYLEVLFMVRYFYGFLYLCFQILETFSLCSLWLEGKIIIVINERESEMSIVIGVGVGKLTWQDEG